VRHPFRGHSELTSLGMYAKRPLLLVVASSKVHSMFSLLRRFLARLLALSWLPVSLRARFFRRAPPLVVGEGGGDARAAGASTVPALAHPPALAA